jgi:hypothetical protein
MVFLVANNPPPLGALLKRHLSSAFVAGRALQPYQEGAVLRPCKTLTEIARVLTLGAVANKMH